MKRLYLKTSNKLSMCANKKYQAHSNVQYQILINIDLQLIDIRLIVINEFSSI